MFRIKYHMIFARVLKVDALRFGLAPLLYARQGENPVKCMNEVHKVCIEPLCQRSW